MGNTAEGRKVAKEVIQSVKGRKNNNKKKKRGARG